MIFLDDGRPTLCAEIGKVAAVERKKKLNYFNGWNEKFTMQIMLFILVQTNEPTIQQTNKKYCHSVHQNETGAWWICAIFTLPCSTLTTKYIPHVKWNIGEQNVNGISSRKWESCCPVNWVKDRCIRIPIIHFVFWQEPRVSTLLYFVVVVLYGIYTVWYVM